MGAKVVRPGLELVTAEAAIAKNSLNSFGLPTSQGSSERTNLTLLHDRFFREFRKLTVVLFDTEIIQPADYALNVLAGPITLIGKRRQ